MATGIDPQNFDSRFIVGIQTSRASDTNVSHIEESSTAALIIVQILIYICGKDIGLSSDNKSEEAALPRVMENVIIGQDQTVSKNNQTMYRDILLYCCINASLQR